MSGASRLGAPGAAAGRGAAGGSREGARGRWGSREARGGAGGPTLARHGTGSPGAEIHRLPPPPRPARPNPAHSFGARSIGPRRDPAWEAPAAADSFATPGSAWGGPGVGGRGCQSEDGARGRGFGRAVSNLGVLRGWGAGLPGGGRLWDSGPLTAVFGSWGGGAGIASDGLRRRGGHLVGTRRSPSEESSQGSPAGRECAGVGVGASGQTSAGRTQSCIPEKYGAIAKTTRILGEKLIKKGGNPLSLFAVEVPGVHELGRGERGGDGPEESPSLGA